MEDAVSDQLSVETHAFAVSVDGAAQKIDWRAGAEPTEGWTWVQLDRAGADVAEWLTTRSGAPQDIAWALLEQDTQPRARHVEEGALLVLRGVNLNPGAAPEDMVSVRLFISDRRVISVSPRPLRAVHDMEKRANDGALPASPAAFLLKLVEDIRANAEPILDNLQAQIERLEDASYDGAFTPAKRRVLNRLRRATSHMRRHIAPQARALFALVAVQVDWLPEDYRDALHEEAAAFERITADLDSLRDRAVILRDEADARTAERANRILLLFSVVSAVFLPLTFLTGLLGVNLAGIPLAESQWAFAGLAALIVVLGVVEILVIRWLKLF